MKSFFSRLLAPLGLASFLVFLSIFPNVGYFGGAHVERGDGGRPQMAYFQVPNSLHRYAIVKFTYSIIYNPLLFPLTWLHGSGYASGSSSMMVYPKAVQQVGLYNVANWPSAVELEENAVMSMFLAEIPPNFLVLFVVALAIEMTKIRSLFACWLGGAIGFIPAGFFGTVAGILIVLLIAGVWKRSHEGMSRRLFG